MQQGLLPLFPLEVVLLPGGHLPLHIFEERYKEMIGEALREKTEFGIVLATRDGLTDTGCTATIEGVLREYPDGRLDIVTLGRRRFELLLVNEERNFLRGAVEFFDDEESSADVSENARKIAADAYNALQVVWKNSPLEEAAFADPRMSFRLARAVKDLALRQTLLKLRTESERMRHLAGYLPALAAHVQKQQAVEDVAPRNGHSHRHNGNGTGPH
jgi:Lon protease-like protein